MLFVAASAAIGCPQRNQFPSYTLNNP